jgi:hypothetical protein
MSFSCLSRKDLLNLQRNHCLLALARDAPEVLERVLLKAAKAVVSSAQLRT